MFGRGQTEVHGSSLIGIIIGNAEKTIAKIACTMTTTTANGGIGSVRQHTDFCAAKRFVQVRDLNIQ